MSKSARRLYGEITKSEKQDDGTIKVWGYASAECVDSDGETITADAMRGARDGYMAFANVREMHDPKKAAGVAIDYEVQEDGRTWFGAHVVDPVAVLKVETGVYKGFSIGAKVPKGGRDGKVIKAIELREVSLVDRPANPEAVFTLVKAEGADADEDEGDDEATKAAAAGEGETVQKGLSEVGDLANLLQSLGWITSRVGWEAQAEGDASPIPSRLVEWLKSGAAILADMATEESAELLAGLQAIAAPTQAAAKADEGGDLTKAGKRFSSATTKALKAAHDACKAADAALAALNYDKSDDADEDDSAGKAASAQTEADEIAKRAADEAAQVDEIAKAAGLTVEASTPHALAKAAVADLIKTRAQLSELMKRAAPPKGHTGAGAQAIAKAADRGDEEGEQVAPVVKADGSTDDVATLIKAAHLQPVRLS